MARMLGWALNGSFVTIVAFILPGSPIIADPAVAGPPWVDELDHIVTESLGICRAMRALS
jgi:hypothetical protein